jgi:hypothetical protein
MIASLVLLSVLAREAPTPADVRLLTGVVATAAARDARLDVLTAEDIRTTADLEASKQMLGCEANTSCLVEMANALGAQFIITGTVGTLGRDQVLQLTILDVEAGRAVGRDTLQGADVGVLATAAKQAVATRLAAVELRATPRARLMVLDFTLAAATTSAQVPTAPVASTTQTGPPLLAIGGVVVAVSALALVGGGVLDAVSVSAFNDVSSTASAADAAAAYDASDQFALGAGVLYGVGGVGVVVGGVVAVFGLVSTPE